MECLKPPLHKNLKFLAIILSVLILVMNFSRPIIRILQSYSEDDFLNYRALAESVHLTYTGVPSELKVCWSTEPYSTNAGRPLVAKLKYGSVGYHHFKTAYGSSKYDKDKWKHEVILRKLSPATTYTVVIGNSGEKKYNFTTSSQNRRLKYQMSFCPSEISQRVETVFYLSYMYGGNSEEKAQIQMCASKRKIPTARKIQLPYMLKSNDKDMFSQKAGNIQLISFNIAHTKREDIVDNTLIWLMNELEAANRDMEVRFVIVLMKKPLFCTRVVNEDLPENIKDVLRVILTLAKVDLVIQQGCEIYERTHPVYDNKPIYITFPEPDKINKITPLTSSYNPDWIKMTKKVKDWAVSLLYSGSTNNILVKSYNLADLTDFDDAVLIYTDYKPNLFSLSKDGGMNGKMYSVTDLYNFPYGRKRHSSTHLVYMAATAIGVFFGLSAAALLLVCFVRLLIIKYY